MRTDLAGTRPWASTTGHPFTAGFTSGTDAWTRMSCGARLATTEHLWWVTTTTASCFPHAFHLSGQTSQPIKGLWAHSAPPDTCFLTPCDGVCVFTCSTHVCTAGFSISLRLFFMRVGLPFSGSAFGAASASLTAQVFPWQSIRCVTFLDLIHPEV